MCDIIENHFAQQEGTLHVSFSLTNNTDPLKHALFVYSKGHDSAHALRHTPHTCKHTHTQKDLSSLQDVTLPTCSSLHADGWCLSKIISALPQNQYLPAASELHHGLVEVVSTTPLALVGVSPMANPAGVCLSRSLLCLCPGPTGDEYKHPGSTGSLLFQVQRVDASRQGAETPLFILYPVPKCAWRHSEQEE